MNIPSNNISGPINLVRLEGSIFGIKKVLYLFMDVDAPVNLQTQCMDILNKDISNFLVDSFDSISRGTKQYDFFLDTDPKEFYQKINDYKKNSFGEVHDLLRQSFYVEPDKADNKIAKSNTFPNIRFHYVNLDNIYNEKAIIDSLYQIFFYDFQNNGPNVSLFSDVNDMINQLRESKKKIYESLFGSLPTDSNNINSNKKNKSKDQKKENNLSSNDQNYSKIFSKIKNKYNHIEIKNNIDKYLEFEIKKNFEEIFKEIDNFNALLSDITPHLNVRIHDLIFYNKYPYYGLLSNIKNKILIDLQDNLLNLIEKNFLLNSKMESLFFIRRFLDKDYITNAIYYKMIFGSSFILYYLIKNYNFKITNINFLKEDINLEAFNEIIKKEIKDDNQINYYIYPSVMYQCIYVKDFPRNFN